MKNRFAGDLSTVSAKEAQEWVEQYIMTKDGCECPVCLQTAKIYDREINQAMAGGLILLSRLDDGWSHIPTLFQRYRIVRSNMGALLRHWGLLQSKRGERPDGNPSNGYYKVTSLGHQFVQNEVTVPQYARLYSAELLELHGKPTRISEVLKAFDYSKLMNQPIDELDKLDLDLDDQ